jgi:hypothetical protein
MNEVFSGFMNDAFSRLLAALYYFGILHFTQDPGSLLGTILGFLVPYLIIFILLLFCSTIFG